MNSATAVKAKIPAKQRHWRQGFSVHARTGAAAFACAALGSISAAHATPDRVSPLQVNIPSLPRLTPKVDVVDNNLAVHILDAQMYGETTPAPTPQAVSQAGAPVAAKQPSAPTPVAAAPAAPVSGQLTIGAVPASPPQTQTVQAPQAPAPVLRKMIQQQPAVLVAAPSAAPVIQSAATVGVLSLPASSQPQTSNATPGAPNHAAATPPANPPVLANATPSRPSVAIPQVQQVQPSQPSGAPSIATYSFTSARATKHFLNEFPLYQPAWQPQVAVVAASAAPLRAEMSLASYETPLPAASQDPAPLPMSGQASQLTVLQPPASMAQAQKPKIISPFLTPEQLAQAEQQKQTPRANAEQPPTHQPAKELAALDMNAPAVSPAQPPSAESALTEEQRSKAERITQAVIAESKSPVTPSPQLSEATQTLSASLKQFDPFAAQMPSFTSWEMEPPQTAAAAQTPAGTEASPSPQLGSANVDNPTLKQAQAPLQTDQNPADQATQVAALPNSVGSTAEMVELQPAASISADTVNAQPLSKADKRVLSNIPSYIDTPKNIGSAKVSVERSRHDPVVFSELGASTSQVEAEHEELGMKIEIRRPALDINTELQQAYQAVLSGNHALALAGYERVLAADSHNLNALYGKAAILHQTGDIDGAKRLYGAVLSRDRDHREALNNYLSIVADESPMDALDELIKLQNKNPHFSPIPAQISYVYQKIGDYPRAIAAMSDAYMLAPDNLTYALNLAILLDRYKIYDQAAEYYQQLVDAHIRGTEIPSNIDTIQERLTFIRSNR